MFEKLFRRRTPVAAATSGLYAPTSARTMPASTAVTPPARTQSGAYTWSLELIRAARDAQLRGQFAQPMRLAEAMRTDDAMFTAYQTRVATQSAIKLQWRPAPTENGAAVCERTERCVELPQHVRQSILGTMVNHGVAIGYVEHVVVDDPEHGPTVRMCLTEWPLEHVRYNPTAGTLETRTRENGTVTITHGDGRWAVFQKFGALPWTQDACVLPGGFVWAAHGGCISDWAGASFSHGQPKILGTLREGVGLGTGINGTLTPEAQAALEVITALVSGDCAAGVLPAGAEAKLLYNGSTAWQVFKELGLDRSKAAQRIYLGTDAALGSQGGAPGVDIGALFSVASSRLQGDLEALERGFREGAILPWAALHGVERTYMPTAVYAMPDTDGERRSEQESAAIERLATVVAAMKTTGLQVTQDTIDALVSVLSVTVPCTLASVETRAIPLQLAPTDVAKVVTVNEARAAQGLPAREGGDITIAEQDAALARASAPPAPPAPTEDAPEDAPDAPEDAPTEDAPEDAP